ncbi:MAG: extracellular solute-binding protein, partial [Propionibacteriaceae bacterium]|nr:extracellular solute-binding protein [Propionibacteriaceae bacterium]
MTLRTKGIAFAAATALALTGLSACGGSPQSPESEPAAVVGKDTVAEITWWGFTPGSPVNEQYVAAFNKEYPNIKVTWKQTSIDDYDAAIRPALANDSIDAYQMSAGSANGGSAIFGP